MPQLLCSRQPITSPVFWMTATLPAHLTSGRRLTGFLSSLWWGRGALRLGYARIWSSIRLRAIAQIVVFLA